MRKLVARVLVVVPVLLGAGVFWWFTSHRSEAPVVETSEPARPVRVLAVAPRTVVPRVRGYGTTLPARTWRAVARVSGRVVGLHPELDSGARVDAGAVLVEIDPAPYQLQIANLEAEIARTRAELEELRLREENDRRTLALERRALELAQTELQRQESLAAQGTVSASQVDGTRQSELAQRRSVQAVEASLALAPSQRAAREATLRAQQARLESAKLDLSYATIACPLDAVLGETTLEAGQFVSAGQVLFEAHGIERVLLEAEVLPEEGRRLIGEAAAARLLAAMQGGRVPEADLAELFRVTVRPAASDLGVHWEGHVVGAREVVSEGAGALRLRVAVDDPWEGVVPGERPALRQGIYCAVDFEGPALERRVVVPRDVLRNDELDVADHEDRLRRRSVDVEFEQGGAAVLRGGLEPGDRVLVSDVGALLPGALLQPVEDEAAAADLERHVGGAAR